MHFEAPGLTWKMGHTSIVKHSTFHCYMLEKPEVVEPVLSAAEQAAKQRAAAQAEMRRRTQNAVKSPKAGDGPADGGFKDDGEIKEGDSSSDSDGEDGGGNGGGGGGGDDDGAAKAERAAKAAAADEAKAD